MKRKAEGKATEEQKWHTDTTTSTRTLHRKSLTNSHQSHQPMKCAPTKDAYERSSVDFLFHASSEFHSNRYSFGRKIASDVRTSVTLYDITVYIGHEIAQTA